MKPELKLTSLKYLILGTGGLGFLLQRLMYTTGTDEKELLISGHWTGISLLILTGLVLGMILLATRKCPALPKSRIPSIPGGIGCLLAAAALFIKSPALTDMDSLFRTEQIMALAAQLSLCILAFCRFTGKKSHFLLPSIISLYLAVRMIGQYRIWCSDPQVMHYAFFLLAHVALMIFAYQLAAAEEAFTSLKSLWRWGLAALYLCCCAPCTQPDRISLLMLGIWVFTALPTPVPEENTGNSTDTQEVTQ